MERHDDAEQHEGARGEEPDANDYPRGRGYGQDYMRGGEVFGGYGYSERPEYALPLADQKQREGAGGETASERGNDAPGDDERRYVRELEAMEGGVEPVPPNSPGGAIEEPSGTPATPDELTPEVPPVAQLEGAFGTETPRNYSRSYYITQAQLQQRLYQPEEEREAPGKRVDVEE